LPPWEFDRANDLSANVTIRACKAKSVRGFFSRQRLEARKKNPTSAEPMWDLFFEFRWQGSAGFAAADQQAAEAQGKQRPRRRFRSGERDGDGAVDRGKETSLRSLAVKTVPVFGSVSRAT
jgi:hypothetical protein